MSEAFGVWFAPLFCGALIAGAVIDALPRRYGITPIDSGLVPGLIRRLPIVVPIAGIVAFVLPVLVYWYTARSHGNAIAGLIPWNDASGYLECSQSILHGFATSESCSRRPFYIAFFTALLWATGNQLQATLVLQALIIGFAAVVYVRALGDQLSGAAQVAAYSVLLLYAANYCASLVMTENAGFLLGLLGLAILWRTAEAPRAVPLFLALLLLAAAQNSRSGAMFVLPALLAWVLFHVEGSWRHRIVLVVLGGVALVAGTFITYVPSLILTGSFGAAQMSGSFSLYGLVAGGKGWLHIYSAHPEIFTEGASEAEIAARVYAVTWQSLIERPHLAAFGYVKGLAHYLAHLFEFSDPFRVLRYAFLVPLWLLGLWYAARRWRETRFALLLWLQVGIFASSPFITFDGGNRVYAASVGVDAALVGFGVLWLAGLRARSSGRPAGPRAPMNLPEVAVALFLLLAPVVFLVLDRGRSQPPEYEVSSCPAGQEAVVIRPVGGSLVVPVVEAGRESLFPLRVRADHYAARMDPAVHGKDQLRQPAGNTMVWGYRLDDTRPSTQLFTWKGDTLPDGNVIQFCVERPKQPDGIFATAIGSPTVINED